MTWSHTEVINQELDADCIPDMHRREISIGLNLRLTSETQLEQNPFIAYMQIYNQRMSERKLF